MTGDREKAKSFKEHATQAGLKKATIDALMAEDYDATEVIELMSENDILEIDISKGQRKLLQKWVSSMQTESQGVPASRGALASDHVETTPDVPPGHATVADVDQLLADGDDDDIWSDQENAAQSNGRPLYINDFLSHISPEERERAVFSQGGTQLIMRSTRQKPSPENVSLAQWITANARILAKMIQNGAMKSHDDILAYLQ